MRSAGKIILMLALLTAPLASACRTGNAFDVENAEPDHVNLVVKNENILSMDVYAVSNGLATRIGRVQGMGGGTFALNSTLYVSSDFRIVATPTSGNGRASSGALQLHAGQTVEFTIANRLSQSHAAVREP